MRSPCPRSILMVEHLDHPFPQLPDKPRARSHYLPGPQRQPRATRLITQRARRAAASSAGSRHFLVMESSPLSPWTWIVPSALGTAGLIAVARRKRKRRAERSKSRRASDRRTYWQQQRIPETDRPAQLEALARIIASSAGTQPEQIRRAVAWTARNRSIWLLRSLADLAAPNDEWGPIAITRPFPSDQPATAIDRTLAETVLDARQDHDPSQGATHGFHRAMQDELARRNQAHHDSETVMKTWTHHYHLKPTVEIDSWIFYRSSTKR